MLTVPWPSRRTIAVCSKAAWALLAFATTASNAQVEPLSRLESEPARGEVRPLDPLMSPSRIFAEGVATVFSGDVATARQVALQAAYAEAIAAGTGVSVGSLTVVKNVREISDFVTSRTRGIITGYEIISEEIFQKHGVHQLRIAIEADVLPEDASAKDSHAALKLFLGVLGQPTIMILMPQFDATMPVSIDAFHQRDYAGSPRASLPQGVLRSTEAAIAQELNGFGYRTSTVDAVHRTVEHNAAEVPAAMSGDTAAALAVAREVGAAALIVGNLVVATRRIAPHGVVFEQATGEMSARAYIVSTGEEVQTFHASSTKAHSNALAAIASIRVDIAEQLSEELAWTIPKLLAESPHMFRVEIAGVRNQWSKVVEVLANLDGVLDARVVRLPDSVQEYAVIELETGFVRLSPAQILAAIEAAFARKSVVERSTPHDLRIELT